MAPVRPLFRNLAWASLAALALASSALADDLCFKDALIAFQQGATQFTAVREALIRRLHADPSAPAFLKTTRNGELPVILVNPETYKANPEIKTYMDSSMGTQIVLQPDWNNDHGLMRDGGVIIDVDTPGARNFGELNETGIAWKKVDSYIPRRKSTAQVILEVSYALRPEEKAVVDYYQRARRAAIFRVKFTFGGADNPEGQPNMLQGGGEHCFVFCKGSAVSSHISEIAGNLRTLGLGDVNAIMPRPEVKAYLAKVREKLMKANVDDADKFKRDLAITPALIKGLDPLFPKTMPPKDRKTAAAWLVAYDASTQYQRLLNALGVTPDLSVNDMNNPRATAILVYDKAQSAEAFGNATYTANGKFYNWTTQGQRPIR